MQGVIDKYHICPK